MPSATATPYHPHQRRRRGPRVVHVKLCKDFAGLHGSYCLLSAEREGERVSFELVGLTLSARIPTRDDSDDGSERMDGDEPSAAIQLAAPEVSASPATLE